MENECEHSFSPSDGDNQHCMSTNEEQKNTPKKVHVKHFEQSEAMCGPAALKILLSHFGKDFSEEQLAHLAHATIDSGTEHEGLVEATKEIGAYVFVKEEGTIEELEYFVEKENLPVIVGWFDKDSSLFNQPVGDHYSVVVSVTDKNVIIVDPQLEAKRAERWLPREIFPKIWFDFVGKDNKIASWGWYMVVTLEKKKFEVKGGHYY